MQYTNQNISLSLIKNMGYFVVILLTLLQLIGYFINDSIPYTTVAVTSMIIPFRFLYLLKFRDISTNMSRFWQWSFWDMSSIVLMILLFDRFASYVSPGMTIAFTPQDIQFSILTGCSALIIHFFVSFWWNANSVQTYDYVPSSLRTWVMLFIAYLIVFVIAAVLSKIYGLSVFGGEGHQLPFKISGIVNFIVFYGTPFFVFFIMDGANKLNIHTVVTTLLVLFVAMISGYCTYSKAALILPFVYYCLYMVFRRTISVRFISIALILALSLFYIASFFMSYRDSLTSIRVASFKELQSSYSVLDYVSRMCQDGIVLAKFHSSIPIDQIGAIMEHYNYNPALIHTRVIDRIPEGRMHSSGATPFAAFYCLGYKGMFFGFFMMSIITTLIDCYLPRCKGVIGSSFVRAFFSIYVTVFLMQELFYQVIMAFIGRHYVIAVTQGCLFTLVILYVKLFYVRVPIQK